MSQTNIDCVVSGDAPSEHKSGIAEKSRRWLVKITPSTSAFAAAQLTAKGISKFHLETGLWRVNFHRRKRDVPKLLLRSNRMVVLEVRAISDRVCSSVIF
jgi:hypothetical protein